MPNCMFNVTTASCATGAAINGRIGTGFEFKHGFPSAVYRLPEWNVSRSGQPTTGSLIFLYAGLTTIPHGSGWPFSHARASGSALMYDVNAQMTSESLDTVNRVAAGAVL